MNNLSNKNVLLLGATGFLGGHLLSVLLRAGCQVIALSREAAPKLSADAKVTWLQAHGDPAQRLAEHRVDIVINCLGTFQATPAGYDRVHYQMPLAWFLACEKLGVRRVIQISALGVEAASDSLFLSSKKKLDDRLAQMDLDWTIIRPSLVFGPGERSMTFFKALALFPILPLVRRGRTRIQPVCVDDLSQCIVQALAHNVAVRCIVPAVGPAAMSWAQLLSLHRRWLGKQTPTIINMPTGMMALFGWCGQIMRSPYLSRQSLNLVQQDNVADARTMADLTARPLTSVATYLTTHPARRRDIWCLWRTWATPLLRIMLALMWIVTGLVSWFVYPHALSHQLLQDVGVAPALAPFFLFSASVMDVLLGVALLLRYRLTQVITLQLLVMVGYTGLISWHLLEFWAHPFGPMLKNLPIIAATLMLLVLEKQE